MRRAVTIAQVLVLAAACDRPPPASQSPPSHDALVVEASAVDVQRAVDTLRQVDEHPLFAMTYEGPAPKLGTRSGAPPKVGAEPRPGGSRASPPPPAIRADAPSTAGRPSFACTVFFAAGDPARPLVGRNFDWDPAPALVLHSRPTDAFASVSLVDLSYVGITRKEDFADPARRMTLRSAPLLPFDGLNEHGLAIGMAADEAGIGEPAAGRRSVGSLGIIRLALDSARTVDEALALFRTIAVDFTGGPPLHYLIADAGGASAVVEFVDGSMRILPKTGTWQLMTNFQLAVTDEAGRQADRRYRVGSQRLGTHQGRLSEQEALGLLKDVRQNHTQWSLVYDLRAGTTAIVTGQRFEAVYRPDPVTTQ